MSQQLKLFNMTRDHTSLSYVYDEPATKSIHQRIRERKCKLTSNGQSAFAEYHISDALRSKYRRKP